MDLTAELRSYGVTKESIRLFDRPEPKLLDYLDLVEPLYPLPVRPAGVAESQGRPLLYFLDDTSLRTATWEQDTALRRLRRALASRGQRAYLALVRPGEIKVVPAAFDREWPWPWKIYRAGESAAATFFSRLALGNYDGSGEPRESAFVFKRMFQLLLRSATKLDGRLDRGDVLSLLGRALFFRFLCDRQIITERDLPDIAPGAGSLRRCFDSAAAASATCRWLDLTFNGDFLPLTRRGSRAYFDEIGQQAPVFKHLGAIVHGADAAGADYQYRLWDAFDFAHVPVGLLSQAYEALCWRWDPVNSRNASVHYTPHNIAATLVEEAFDRLPRADRARVLDPACGAGIFLVLALRRLYRERWQTTGTRPDTRVIRRLLNEQITGFDISEPALRLAALSLYLTAIELDPQPVPPSKLAFEALRDNVLFHLRRPEDSPEGIVIGSLGAHVPERFDHAFDLVLSNPPWTSLDKEETALASELTAVSRAVVARQLGPEPARQYANPDRVPDLPFLLKSTEWCRSAGRIAMALPARLLFKQAAVPRHARETLFRVIEVNGIVNGSNLSDTNVWPQMGQPFILLFATNRQPRANHRLRFITPLEDRPLNRRGEVRIDSKSAQRVEVTDTFAEPWLWKALTVGTVLDVDVIRRVRSKAIPLLREYWSIDRTLSSCTGYMIKPKQPQRDARFLRDLPNVTGEYEGRFTVDASSLGKFGRATAFRPRTRDDYRAPLVLLRQSPGADRALGYALLAREDVAFSQDYYGYSAAKHAERDLLTRYLFLFCHSNLWIHYVLLTSPVFGVERRVIYKTDLDECPVVPAEQLGRAERQAVRGLSDRLMRGDTSVLVEVDQLFAALYGLDELDLEVVRDTLAVSLPYEPARARAGATPTRDEREAFRKRVESLLQPFFRALGKRAHVRLAPHGRAQPGGATPFGLILIGVADRPVALPPELLERDVLPLAHETGATRVILETDGGLIVGVLDQYRYWTASRARLLAAEILRAHFAGFE